MAVDVFDLFINRKLLNFILETNVQFAILYATLVLCIAFCLWPNQILFPYLQQLSLNFFPAIKGTIVSKCAFFLIITNMVFYMHIEAC